MGRPGSYQLQAAILADHATAPTWETTPWPAIVDLYDALLRIEPTPVVALNRALALAERDGPEAALAAMEPLAPRLDRYHLFHAARAEMLRRLGRDAEAVDADRRALELTDNPAERQLLAERLSRAGAAPMDPRSERPAG
jgi:RNA polymerase sigma-70 factor (ECF subfamily)